MKNPLISLLSQKQNYLTPTGRIEFLIELNREAFELGSLRINKIKMIDSIMQKKGSRYNRGIIYQQKKFFGVKYLSVVSSYDEYYQEPLINLCKHTLDFAAKNDLLSVEYIHTLHILKSNLQNSLEIAKSIEEKEILLSW